MIKNVEKILEKFTRRAEKQIQDSREKEAVNLKREQQIIYWRTEKKKIGGTEKNRASGTWGTISSVLTFMSLGSRREEEIVTDNGKHIPTLDKDTSL